MFKNPSQKPSTSSAEKKPSEVTNTTFPAKSPLLFRAPPAAPADFSPQKPMPGNAGKYGQLLSQTQLDDPRKSRWNLTSEIREETETVESPGTSGPSNG